MLMTHTAAPGEPMRPRSCVRDCTAIRRVRGAGDAAAHFREIGRDTRTGYDLQDAWDLCDLNGFGGGERAWEPRLGPARLAGVSRPGMEFLVGPAQPVHTDMGIDLRGGYIGVAEHLLDRAQVGSVVEEVGGERVAQHVGRHVLLDVGAWAPRFTACHSSNGPCGRPRRQEEVSSGLALGATGR